MVSIVVSIACRAHTVLIRRASFGTGCARLSGGRLA
jgi:hypothetical protein